MEIKKVIKVICYIYLGVMSFFGMMFLGILIHELSHYQDYKNIAENNFICLLDIKDPSNFTYQDLVDLKGVFEYNVNDSNKQAEAEIGKDTEFRAYLKSSIFSIVWMVAFFAIIIIKYIDWKKRKIEKEEKDIIKELDKLK